MMAVTSTQPDTRNGGPAGIPWKDLASNIINRHMTEDDVLDNKEMAKLKDFLSDENVASRRAAEARGDHSHTPANGYPSLTETTPEQQTSLVEYIIRRHGTEDQRLLDGELEELRSWFRNGGGQINPRYST